MKYSLFSCLASLSIFMTSASPLRANPSLYQIDDGGSEVAAGVGSFNGADMIALNQFTVIGGNNMIGSVSIAWGSAVNPNSSLNRLSYTAVIWSDPNGDGDPTDAQVLGTAPGVVSSANTDTFNVSLFPGCVTVTPSFFVGFIITYGPSQNPGNITAVDETAPLLNRSFLTGSAVGAGNIYNLGSNSVPLKPVEFFGLNGNWMIRADSCTAVPEPSSFVLFTLGAIAGLLGLARRERKQASVRGQLEGRTRRFFHGRFGDRTQR